jgi:glutamine cyclotransferase
MKQLHSLTILLVAVLTACLVILFLLNSHSGDSFSSLDWDNKPETVPELLNYTYRVVNVYPHDPDAFTQGLVYFNGSLYEGTGN